MLQSATIKFLRDLDKHNQKDWFDAHRGQYQAAKEDFALLVDHVIQEHAKKDPSIATETAKTAIFRINRDVRFSKNKDPYKNNLGAGIARGGRKSPYAGYYIHLQPGNNSFVGGGLWKPEPAALKKIRQEIDYNWPEFRKIIRQKKFAAIYGDLDDSAVYGEEISTVREPKGYTKDNPAIEYIKLKSFTASLSLTDKELLQPDLETKILAAFGALQPLLHFMNNAVAATD